MVVQQKVINSEEPNFWQQHASFLKTTAASIFEKTNPAGWVACSFNIASGAMDLNSIKAEATAELSPMYVEAANFIKSEILDKTRNMVQAEEAVKTIKGLMGVAWEGQKFDLAMLDISIAGSLGRVGIRSISSQSEARISVSDYRDLDLFKLNERTCIDMMQAIRDPERLKWEKALTLPAYNIK